MLYEIKNDKLSISAKETLQDRRIRHTILYCPLICIIFYSFFIPLLIYLHIENYCMSPAHF